MPDHIRQEEPTSALKCPRCVAVFLAVAALGATLDLWTKHEAFARLGWPSEHRPSSGAAPCPDEPPVVGAHEIIPCWFRFRTSLNPGGIWGWFDGNASALALFSLVAMGFVLYWFATAPRERRFLQFGLALIFAGATGNFYDRVFIRCDFVESRYVDSFGVERAGRSIGRLRDDARLRIDGTEVPLSDVHRLEALDTRAPRDGKLPDGSVRVVRSDKSELVGKLDADTPLALAFDCADPKFDRPEQYNLLPMGSVLRIRRNLGAVRDFFDVHYKNVWDYPIFNVADALLVTGVCMLLLVTFGDARDDFRNVWIRIRRLFGSEPAAETPAKPR